MSRFEQTARVVSNPFSELDHKARPCGIVPVEPRAAGQNLGLIGARIDRDKTRKFGEKKPGDIGSPAQDTVYAFTAEPTTVRRTEYYRDHLRTGALLPADKKTAAWAGVEFVDPEKAIADAKAKSEAEFDLNYGAGSVAILRGEAEAPASPAPTPAPSTNAAPAAESPRRGGARSPRSESESKGSDE